MTSGSAAGCASAGVVCRISLGGADIALAWPVGVSADANCALELATEGGIAVEPSPSLSATSGASAFLAVEDFSATLLDLRCAYFFEWRAPRLAYLFSARGAPAAVSGSEVTAALSAPGSACDGPAKHTKSPVASISAECPLALIVIGNLPICQPPKRNETSRRVRSGAEKGNLRASPGERRATIVPRAVSMHLFARSFRHQFDGCQRKRSIL